jgi:hypothetical protein
MTVALTQSEANAKIAQIEAARDQAVSQMNQIQDTQQSMLASSWQGGSATTYGNTSQQQAEDFTQIIATLNNIVELGSTHIRSIASMDNS